MRQWEQGEKSHRGGGHGRGPPAPPLLLALPRKAQFRGLTSELGLFRPPGLCNWVRRRQEEAKAASIYLLDGFMHFLKIIDCSVRTSLVFPGHSYEAARASRATPPPGRYWSLRVVVRTGRPGRPSALLRDTEPRRPRSGAQGQASSCGSFPGSVLWAFARAPTHPWLSQWPGRREGRGLQGREASRRARPARGQCDMAGALGGLSHKQKTSVPTHINSAPRGRPTRREAGQARVRGVALRLTPGQGAPGACGPAGDGALCSWPVPAPRGTPRTRTLRDVSPHGEREGMLLGTRFGVPIKAAGAALASQAAGGGAQGPVCQVSPGPPAPCSPAAGTKDIPEKDSESIEEGPSGHLGAHPAA